MEGTDDSRGGDAIQTGITVFLGTGRSGKTYSAHHYLLRHPDRPTAFLGYPEDRIERMRPYLDAYAVRDLNEIENGSRLFLDDIGIHLFSRDFSSKFNKRFTQWLTIISHKDIEVVMTTQTMRIMDVGAQLSQRVRVIQKFMSEPNIRVDSEEWQNPEILANKVIEDTAEILEIDKRNIAYNHETARIMIAPFGRVPYWDDSFSKPFAEVKLS